MDDESSMDFLDSGMDEVAAGMDSGAGGGGDASGGGLSPPQTTPLSGSGAGSPPPASAAPWQSLPKSWKKDYEQHWGKFDPTLQQYIHEREKQALDGIMQYKTQVDGWNELMEPFKPWIEQYKLDPREVTGRMMNAHLALSYGTPEQKAQIARALIQDYGLEELLSAQGQQGQGASPNDSAALRQLLQPIAQKVQQLESMTLTERQQKISSEVNTFMSDPKNEFAGEVVQDMVRLIKQGLAQDLPSAYDMACRLNPSVAEKIIQRKVEAATKPQRPAPTNVTSSPVPPAPTAKLDRSIEEEMSAIFDNIVNR